MDSEKVGKDATTISPEMIKVSEDQNLSDWVDFIAERLIWSGKYPLLDAEDGRHLALDAAGKVCEALAKGTKIEALKAYANQVVTRCFIDANKQRRRQQIRSLEDNDAPLTVISNADRDFEISLKEIKARLSPSERKCLNLLLDGAKDKEIRG